MSAAQSPPGSIRSFDLAHDGEIVADLIEDAFDLRNDPDGEFILRQMRENTRRLQQAGWMQLAGMAPGFVWEVEGCLVGNISVIPCLNATRQLHLIANVAVAPEFRGMGIGKALTAHALRYSRQAGIRDVRLQVKRENGVAIKMYKQLGFHEDYCLNVWKRGAARVPAQTPHHRYLSLFEVRNREFGDWQSQKEWLRHNYPPSTRWYSTLSFGDLSPWAWLNPLRWLDSAKILQRSLFAGDRLAAVLSWQRTRFRSDNLYIAAPTGPTEGEHVGVLLTRFLEEDWAGKPLTVEYPADRAAKGFEGSGFNLARTLLWMQINQ